MKLEGFYKLDEQGEPVPCDDLHEWSKGIATTVAKTRVGSALISTVFLGIDHSFGGKHPLLWETMVFNCPRFSCYQDRCGGSRRCALAMHKEACRMVWEQTTFIGYLSRLFKALLTKIGANNAKTPNR